MNSRALRMERNVLIIEKMEAQDLDEVLEIECSSSLSPWSKKMFVEEMENPLAHCFVIRMRERPGHSVIGFICFRTIGDESELLNICVHPQYRQTGIGRSLMEFYLGFCRKKRIKRFYLEVNASNESAVHLYQLFSYQSSGVRKKFYQGKFDALLMARKA